MNPVASKLNIALFAKYWYICYVVDFKQIHDMKKYILALAVCFCVLTVKAQSAATQTAPMQNSSLQKAPSLTNDQLKTQTPHAHLKAGAKGADNNKAATKAAGKEQAEPANKSQQISNLQK